jgi:hypothetical protein
MDASPNVYVCVTTDAAGQQISNVTLQVDPNTGDVTKVS